MKHQNQLLKTMSTFLKKDSQRQLSPQHKNIDAKYIDEFRLDPFYVHILHWEKPLKGLC